MTKRVAITQPSRAAAALVLILHPREGLSR